MTLQAVFIDSQAYVVNEGKKIIISEPNDSEQQRMFVVVSDKESNKELYVLEFACNFYSSLFRNIEIWYNYIVIGFERSVFLFNTNTEKTIRHSLKSYFNNFFTTNELLLVCSTSNINCFNKKGDFLWRSEKLGSEQVSISNITGNTISGSGKWVENGEWTNFIIDRESGQSSSKQTKKKGFFEKFLYCHKNKDQ